MYLVASSWLSVCTPGVQALILLSMYNGYFGGSWPLLSLSSASASQHGVTDSKTALFLNCANNWNFVGILDNFQDGVFPIPENMHNALKNRQYGYNCPFCALKSAKLFKIDVEFNLKKQN